MYYPSLFPGACRHRIWRRQACVCVAPKATSFFTNTITSPLQRAHIAALKKNKAPAVHFLCSSKVELGCVGEDGEDQTEKKKGSEHQDEWFCRAQGTSELF